MVKGCILRILNATRCGKICLRVADQGFKMRSDPVRTSRFELSLNDLLTKVIYPVSTISTCFIVIHLYIISLLKVIRYFIAFVVFLSLFYGQFVFVLFLSCLYSNIYS